ncbi:MAG: TPM domain-containing protein [Hyphomicrobiaceae bacterium]|nr:TPM domain-containing protein [Hyphomicrobiaceae bacterium]
MDRSPGSNDGACGSDFRRLTRALVVLLVTFVFLAAPARAADPQFPELTGRVIDSAGLLSPEQEQALTIDLEALESKSTDQVVVVTLPSLQGFPIEEFGYKLGRHWEIGQKGKDNGVLLIVAPKERKVRIEVGRGLEPLLTDALTKLIIENAILPRFKKRDFPGGIRAGVRDILAVLTGDAEELKLRARQEPDRTDRLVTFIIVAIWLAIFALVLWSIVQAASQNTKQSAGRKSKKGRDSGGWTWGSGGSSGGGWSSGGGFSGGGGGFGGGGSSGGW